MATLVDIPELIPTPEPGRPRYGLFNAATVTDDLGPRGIASGFQIAAEDCGPGHLFNAQCAGLNPPKVWDHGLPYMEALPYWVYSTRQCGMVGRTMQEMARSVRRRFAGAEQSQVEHAIWIGGVGASPTLTLVPGVVTVTPAAAGADAAIAALEESFYSSYGYVGTIHVNSSAVGSARYARMVEVADSAMPSPGTLVTPLGSKWAFSSHYGINGPANVPPAAGNVWAFMTPPVIIRRSEIISQDDDVRSTMDREFNQYLGLAERVYAHTWTCPVVHAVQIPLTAVGAA